MSTHRQTLGKISSLLIVALLFSLFLSFPVSADSPIKIEYGYSDPPNSGVPHTTVKIWGDPSLIPLYDPYTYGYIFSTWMAPAGEEIMLENIADVKAESTTFTMPDLPVHYIAHYEWVERPGEPTITNIVGHDNGLTISWDPPKYGAVPTGYVVEDGYDTYVLGPDARSHAINDMTDGKTYTMVVYALHRGVTGHVAKKDGTAGATKYTIHFDPNNGNPATTATVKKADFVLRPADPVRAGYDFRGWFLAADTSQIVKFDVPIYEDQYYIALWKPSQYTVTFDSAGGSPVANQSIESGKAAVKPADPTRSGYTFTGWFTGDAAYDFAAPVTANLTLTARWSEIKKWNVTFDSQGGSAVAPISVDEGKTAVKPADPIRDQYAFGGWFLSGKRYDFNTPVSADLTLAARWDRVYPEYDLKKLIGEPGKLDGLLCQAIGLSGTYDPATVVAGPGPNYPSVCLTLRDVPGAALIFSNPPRSRVTGDQPFDPVDGYALRFDSQSRFQPFCAAGEVVRTKLAEGDGHGDEQLEYKLTFADGIVLRGRDYVTHFASSDGLIHLRYPAVEEDYVLGRFEEILAAISTKEGVRPVIAFAQFDLRQTEVETPEKLLYILDGLSHFFLQEEETDLRLNAELFEHAAARIKADAAVVSKKILADQQALNAAPDEAAKAALVTELQKFDAFGMSHEIVYGDDGKMTSLKLNLLPGRFFNLQPAVLPEDYQPVLSFLEQFGQDLTAATLPGSGPAWTIRLNALSNLACLVETRPAWSDPILKFYEKELAASFAACLSAQGTAENLLNAEIMTTYTDYLAQMPELDLTLPEGVLAKRIGVYIEMVRDLKTKIEAKGNAALSPEEMETFMRQHMPQGR